MIELSGVSRTYGLRAGRRVEALSGVSLGVAAGESVAVVGPNGAGKSTLLALVLGFLRPTDGEVSVGGKAAREWVNANGAGWLPERFELPREWTVRGALRALAGLEGARSGARGRVDETLERFGLSRYARRTVGSLSRGLLQRLGLAQAFIGRRTLVILDEPTNGLDPQGRRLFRETVTDLRAAGTTLLIASHDLAELERTTARAIVLEAGRIREILDVSPTAAAGVFMLQADAAEAIVREVFPGATRLGEAGPDARSPVRWAVTVDDVGDLNARLARLLALGGLVHEVAPAALSLEERIRSGGPGDT